MTQVQKINFQVDMNAGELPYRTYVSTGPVLGNIFVLVSKLLADDTVFFQLYTCSTVTKDATVRVERTTSQEKFHESVKVLERDLQKSEPSVTMVQQNGPAIAVGVNGPIDTDKVGGVEGLQKLLKMKQMLQEKRISPLDFVTEMIKDGIMPAQDLADLITKFPLELQIQLADRLKNEFAGHGPHIEAHGNHLINGLKDALNAQKHLKQMMGQTPPVKPETSQPSSRISKFL